MSGSPGLCARQAAAEASPEAVPSPDGVFLHCMALHKGRGMVARALRLLHAPLATPEGLPGAYGPSLVTRHACLL